METPSKITNLKIKVRLLANSRACKKDGFSSEPWFCQIARHSVHGYVLADEDLRETFWGIIFSQAEQHLQNTWQIKLQKPDWSRF